MATRKRILATSFPKKLQLAHSRKLASPHFFKAVIRPLVEGMKIPVVFMRRYGDSLQKVVVLEVPNGAKWRVAVRKVDGETWLREGLQEFGEFYSIKEGHVLVFRYKGNSRFKILICDTTTSEIDYPVKSGHKEAINGQNISIKRETVKPNHGRRSRQGRVTGGNGRDEGITSSKAPHQSSKATRNLVMKKKDVTEENRARESNPENPSFSFTVQSSQLNRPHRVYVPIEFAKTNFGEENCRMSLEIRSGKKSWPVRFSIYGRRAQVYGSGWIRFAEENQLKLGDVFSLELIKEKKVFNVYRRG